MRIIVRPDRRLVWDGAEVRCALGRSGITIEKREGDGATPAGAFPLRRVLYRPDRLARPETGLPVDALVPTDGWCDDPNDRAYNRAVDLPYPARHERLWREDEIYDVVVVLGCNDDPVVPGAGSAIFLHVARADYSPTEGCVAVALDHLLRLLGACGNQAVLEIRPPSALGLSA